MERGLKFFLISASCVKKGIWYSDYEPYCQLHCTLTILVIVTHSTWIKPFVLVRLSKPKLWSRHPYSVALMSGFIAWAQKVRLEFNWAFVGQVSDQVPVLDILRRFHSQPNDIIMALFSSNMKTRALRKSSLPYHYIILTLMKRKLYIVLDMKFILIVYSHWWEWGSIIKSVEKRISTTEYIWKRPDTFKDQ